MRRLLFLTLALVLSAALGGAVAARTAAGPATAPAVLPPTMPGAPVPGAPGASVAVPDSLRGYPVVIGATQRLDGSPAQHPPLQLFARDTLVIIGQLYLPGVGWITDTVRVTSAPAPAVPVPERRPRS